MEAELNIRAKWVEGVTFGDGSRAIDLKLGEVSLGSVICLKTSGNFTPYVLDTWTGDRFGTLEEAQRLVETRVQKINR